MGKAQRRKGQDFERAVARLFAAAMPGSDARRGIGQSRSGGEVADVDVPVFWVECKVGARPPVRGALEQAQKAAGPGRIPVAVIKEDRRQPFVVLTLDDFLELVTEWWRAVER